MSQCKHISLFFGAPDSLRVEYRQPKEQQRRDDVLLAEPASKKRKTSHNQHSKKYEPREDVENIKLPPETDFPPPLVVPGHELTLNPKYPRQSAQDWFDEKHRNSVTAKRNKIYVAAPPKVPKGMSYVNKWATPSKNPSKNFSNGHRRDENITATPSPSVEHVMEYLQAFYHGMEVKLFESPLLEWIDYESPGKPRKSKKGKRASQEPDCIALSNGRQLIRISSRPSPDGLFSGQLNQLHLLEVAMDVLPDDAYALVMLFHHDLYEDEDDDFCCGRAYGGSRVCVLNMARYRPELDARQDIDREHLWPASHCKRHLASLCSAKALAGPPENKKDRRNALEYHPGSAIAAAVMAHNKLPTPSSPSELSALWLGRMCKTVAHELGHCFGIDHCVYWACSMQGTAHITEDHRQPPYLCPVDLAKVLRATGADERERYKALLAFCDRWKDDRMFAAHAQWIRKVLESH